MLHTPMADRKRKSNSPGVASPESGERLAGIWQGPNQPLASYDRIGHCAGIARLQKAYGNQAVLRMFSSQQLPTAGALQRSCACGGTCPACRQKRESSPPSAESDHRIPHMPALRNQLAEGETEETASEQYNEDGLRTREQGGSGTCVQAGAVSSCDPNTGVYRITGNNNTCCTKGCSTAHEQQHVNFETSAGCCKALSVAWSAKGADKAALAKKYSQWVSDTESYAECKAYTNDVTCSDAMAKDKDCSGKGKGTDCCKDIEAYRSAYGALAKSYCAKAPAKPAACPAY